MYSYNNVFNRYQNCMLLLQLFPAAEATSTRRRRGSDSGIRKREGTDSMRTSKNKLIRTHCTSRFKRVMFTSCRRHADVHVERTPVRLRPPEPNPYPLPAEGEGV